MNDKDKAAFEAWFFTEYNNRGPVEENAALAGWQTALAHRDKQIAGLVEALKPVLAYCKEIDQLISHRPDEAMRVADMFDLADIALAAWEASK